MKKYICAVLTAALLAGLALTPAVNAADKDYVLLGDLTPTEAVTIDEGRFWVDETGMTPGVNVNIGNAEYSHGIAFHPMANAPAYLVYNVEGKGYKTFYAVAGKDRASGRDVGETQLRGTRLGTQVYVDGVLAAESGELPYPETYTYIVNIEGAKEVKIQVDAGTDGLYCDTASWANALFSKEAASDFTVPAELAGDVVTAEPTEEPTPAPTNPPDLSEREMVYLSDMAWKDAMIYSGANNGVPARDGNVADEELWIGDVYYEKGVCLHANPGTNSYIEVDLTGLDFKLFAAYAGTAVSEKFDVSMASVRFTFFVDGNEVRRTEVLHAEDDPELITIDVSGAKTLRIEMDDGGDGISGDWGALGSAAFGKSTSVDDLYATPTPKPTAVPATPTEKPEPTAAPAKTDAPEATGKHSEDDETDGKPVAVFPVIPVVLGGAALVAAAVTAVILIKNKKH